MKIGFLGSGNMAEALVKGVIAAGLYPARDILVYDIQTERIHYMVEAYRVSAAGDAVDLVSRVDLVVLAVKPQNFGEVLDEIRPAVRPDTVVLSIAAGVTTGRIASALGDVAVIRVMPNTPALVGQAASGLFSANASADAMHAALRLFASVGRAVVVDSEDLLDAVTAVSGSGPAYFFLLMEHMIQAGRELGLSDENARNLVLQTAKGAALLADSAAEGGQTPAELREKVTSPGGTTAAALKVFADHNLGQIVNEALQAAAARGRELAG